MAWIVLGWDYWTMDLIEIYILFTMILMTIILKVKYMFKFTGIILLEAGLLDG